MMVVKAKVKNVSKNGTFYRERIATVQSHFGRCIESDLELLQVAEFAVFV